MQVREIMTQPPCTCTLDTSLALASRRMAGAGSGTLVVLDRTGRAAGILTDRALAMAVGETHFNPARMRAADAMTVGVESCHPDDEVRDAVKRMGSARVRRLPVIARDGDLKGVISIDDIILWGLVNEAVPSDEVIAALRAICAAHWPVQ